MEQENQCAAAENERGTMKILKGIVVAENERGRVTRDITTRVQSNEMQCSGHVGSSTMKPFVLASNLPDLSSSVSPSLMFHRLATAEPKKIIIDTDPGIDDAMAIFLALRSPEVEVIGLTTIYGNVYTTLATRNALHLLEVAGRTDIPVAEGSHVTITVCTHSSLLN
ncbi:hypothetical protein DKX38_011949 [Salix brachista]|uniref:Inosine/uridine-preferring nucleoside hydrolase domain-containing protein n=1 Tax=Salix brachista TaxID=2182728 RepID=A0A5N5M2V2_9ROSI|nr:hypothetical protein DKX38_011949 [Salix brachista]